MSGFSVVDLIIAKRDGHALSSEAIQFIVDGYTTGGIPDYQMSAFLMAAFLRGMDESETLALADAMLHSGKILDLSSVPGIKVDKHSTGGVGDKVSLLLAPIVAACGVPVPMMSGRGLGHTGGTLDKLEAIPGFRTDLTSRIFAEQLGRLGTAMIGQTDEVAPADKLIYALRDVTGTVEFIPFIASSIMSKKLAEGIDALVLDVKVGRGAFMKELEPARRLAQTLVALSEREGKPAVAWLTDMDTPLGRAVGNWPEVAESVAGLRGEGPPDLMEVTLALAGEMIALGGRADDPSAGKAMAEEAIYSGRALKKFESLVEAQGGHPDVLEDPNVRQGRAAEVVVLAPASAAGYVSDVDALRIGQAAVSLGAGRRRKEDAVDSLAGIVLEKVVGDPVRPGDVLARAYASDETRVGQAVPAIAGAFGFSAEKPVPRYRLIERSQ